MGLGYRKGSRTRPLPKNGENSRCDYPAITAGAGRAPQRGRSRFDLLQCISRSELSVSIWNPMTRARFCPEGSGWTHPRPMGETVN